MDTGDGEISRELDLSNIPNSRVEVLERTASIDVGEQIRRLDEVTSSTGSSEVVRGGHWWGDYFMR